METSLDTAIRQDEAAGRMLEASAGHTAGGRGRTDTRYSIRDLGIPVTKPVTETILGKRRSWASLKIREWVYMALSLAWLTASIGLTVERLITLAKGTPDITFAILLLWTTFFCYVYVMDGILHENANEIAVFIATKMFVVIYTTINYVQNSGTGPMKLVRLILVCSVGPLLAIYGAILGWNYCTSKALIIRLAKNSTPAQVKMLKNVFLLGSLLKLDLQLAGSSLILWMRNGFTGMSLNEQIVIGVGVVTTVMWTATGFLAVRRENTNLVYAFLVACPLEPALIIWNMIRFQSKGSSVLANSVYACGAFGLLLRVMCVIFMIIAWRNFGQGVKEMAYNQASTTENARC